MHSSLRAFLLVSVTLVALVTYADAKSVRDDCKVPFCTACDNDKGECAKCNDGYHPSDDKKSCVPNACDASVLNCERCTADNGTTCQTCSPGYTVNSQDGSCAPNACDASVQNCERCTEDGGSACQTCSSGYTLNKDSLCVMSSDAASRAPGSALAAVALLVTGAAAYAM